MIKLHNTKTRRKEEFTPIDPENVRMYVCGPTVYDRAHLGNARPVVVFDVLYRLLKHVYGGKVTYVRNFTDVDDKINAKAAATGRSIREITDETIGWYHEDMDALGALRPDHEPRATEYIEPMVAMIVDLIEKGHAYEAEGHVLFDVNSYDAYGALSGRKLEDMRAGERVEIADYKRDPMDFVLWKPSSGKQPGWESPWGFGRPGWHIECSAMSLDLLGESFDIHGGGLDLQFPHHENEIAQSCCANPHGDFARYWLHNEMLQVEGKKMSKSLGNFFTVRELIDQGVPPEVIRFVLLSTHYRSPMDWTDKKMKEAADTLEYWASLCEGKEANPKPPVSLIDALADDLNTAGAISVLHGLASTKNIGALSAGIGFLGFDGIFKSGLDLDIELSLLISELLLIRQKARQEKNYSVADEIRDAFIESGVKVEDTSTGPVWKLERGLLDSWPFHDRFRKATASGDSQQIATAKEDAKAAGISFSENADSSSSPAWVGPPTAKHVIKVLQRALESLK